MRERTSTCEWRSLGKSLGFAICVVGIVDWFIYRRWRNWGKVDDSFSFFPYGYIIFSFWLSLCVLGITVWFIYREWRIASWFMCLGLLFSPLPPHLDRCVSYQLSSCVYSPFSLELLTWLAFLFLCVKSFARDWNQFVLLHLLYFFTSIDVMFL